MGGQVAARELGERTLAVDRPRQWCAEPVAREDEALLAREDGDAAQRGEHEQMRRGLALRADAAGGDPLGEGGTRERPLVGQRALDHGHGAVRVIGCDAFLPQPTPARSEPRRRGQGQQPRVVLRGHEVLGPALSGNDSVVIGQHAGPALTSGSGNIIIGATAGGGLTSGGGNIYLAADAAAASESSTIRIGTGQ